MMIAAAHGLGVQSQTVQTLIKAGARGDGFNEKVRHIGMRHTCMDARPFGK